MMVVALSIAIVIIDRSPTEYIKLLHSLSLHAPVVCFSLFVLLSIVIYQHAPAFQVKKSRRAISVLFML